MRFFFAKVNTLETALCTSITNMCNIKLYKFIEQSAFELCSREASIYETMRQRKWFK